MLYLFLACFRLTGKTFSLLLRKALVESAVSCLKALKQHQYNMFIDLQNIN